MNDNIAGHLVWFRGQRGFYANKRPVGYQPTQDAPTPVATYPLARDEYALTIAILEQRYPPPKEAPAPKIKLEGAPS